LTDRELLSFRNRSEWRSWLEENHGRAREAWVVHYKKSSGKSGVTYDEAVEEALCFGWIDGKKRSIDEERYAFRFSPRGRKSSWSDLNIRRVRALIEVGKMTQAGLDAFRNHKQQRVQPMPATLPANLEKKFRTNAEAWRHFRAQPSGYQKHCVGWIASAKRETTQLRRLGVLIDHSAAGNKIRFM
jgi:uncharacterized protein YdeI (YjbR/CyaY-like superfamily)